MSRPRSHQPQAFPPRGGSGAARTAERHTEDAATGLFGPASQTWRLHSEPVAGLAVLRGLLLAALHPANPAAFDDVWVRHSRASELLGAVSFGTPGQALAAAARERIELAMRGHDELGAWLRASGLALEDVSGLMYEPWRNAARVISRTDVNYLACASKPDAA